MRFSWKTRSQLKLKYAQPDPQHLLLAGKSGDEDVLAHLHKVDEKQFLLTGRRFHWISEYPFNR